MKVLVACEYSGIVRDAFEDAGWNAWSCDLLPTESEQTKQAGKHIQGDVLRILNKNRSEFNDWEDCVKLGVPCNFDLLIGHPPCTYLSFAYTGKERYSIARLQEKIKAYQFFLDLWGAPIEHICLENPMGYIHTGLLPCSQIVEPYYFGDNYKKRTCLWLKNLPKLEYVKIDNLFEYGTMVTPEYRMISKKIKSKPLPAMFDRCGGKDRSRFHKGIAVAMAKQWTNYIENKKQKTKIKTNKI